MLNIEKEPFEAWLFAQDRNRRFQYGDPCNCLCAAFIKENSNEPTFFVAGDRIYFGEIPNVPSLLVSELDPLKTAMHPAWLMSLLSNCEIWHVEHVEHGFGRMSMAWTTFGEMQDHWKRLFPEPATCRQNGCEPVAAVAA